MSKALRQCRVHQIKKSTVATVNEDRDGLVVAKGLVEKERDEFATAAGELIQNFNKLEVELAKYQKGYAQ